MVRPMGSQMEPKARQDNMKTFHHLPICPYCGKAMTKSEESRDHILPKKRGGNHFILNNPDHKDGILNIRICHRWCNNLKEHADDCPAVLACARAVAEDNPFHTRLNRRTRSILLRWNLMYKKPKNNLLISS